METLKKLPAAFYATAQGREPVREWLRALSEQDRRIVGRDIATAEYGWPVGMPLSKALGAGLFEIRSDIADGRTARILLAIVQNRMVLLHALVKKTQKLPEADLALARRRLKEILP